MLLPSFIGPAYFDTLSPGLSASRLINFYLELNQADTKSPACLRGTPGTTLFSTLVGGRTCRGFHVVNGVLYAVIGTHLRRCDSSSQGTESSTERMSHRSFR